MDKRKFAASYSGGKDGALALYRAIESGHTPLCLLTTYNGEEQRSWFHGIPAELLTRAAESMGIPLKLIKTGEGDDYAQDFERALAELKEVGADTCVFGDIDIREHYDWCDQRCQAVGVQSMFPLWNESREELVYELIDRGFRAIITIVDTSRMSERFLGKTLTRELAKEIAAEGADICGENGEYHSFVYDGPIFCEPVRFQLGDAVQSGKYKILPVLA